MKAAEVMHGSQGDECNVLTLDEGEFIRVLGGELREPVHLYNK